MNDNCTSTILKIIIIIFLILPYKYEALIHNKTHTSALIFYSFFSFSPFFFFFGNTLLARNLILQSVEEVTFEV